MPAEVLRVRPLERPAAGRAPGRTGEEAVRPGGEPQVLVGEEEEEEEEAAAEAAAAAAAAEPRILGLRWSRVWREAADSGGAAPEERGEP